jgi:hypothetical protein
MARPTITLLRAVLVAVLTLCLWKAAEAKTAAGDLMVRPCAPRAAVEAKGPNVCVAGRIVDPSGSQTTFGIALGGDRICSTELVHWCRPSRCGTTPSAY